MIITSSVSTTIKGVPIVIGTKDYKNKIDHKDPATALALAVLRDDICCISFHEILAGDAELKAKKTAKEKRAKEVKEIWKGHRKNIEAGEMIASNDMAVKKSAKEKADVKSGRINDPVGKIGKIKNPDSGGGKLSQ